jgi:hypothetical protein
MMATVMVSLDPVPQVAAPEEPEGVEDVVAV